MKKIIAIFSIPRNAVVLAFFLLIAYILIGRAAGLVAGDWGTWTGGIGTVGTLIGTIVLANSQNRRADIVAQQIAVLHAANLVIRLHVTESELNEISTNLENYLRQGGDWRVVRDAKDQAATIPIWTLEELLPLVALPGFIAVTLAHNRGQILSFPRMLEIVLKLISDDSADAKRQLKTVVDLFRSTQEMLEGARIECKNAVNNF